MSNDSGNRELTNCYLVKIRSDAIPSFWPTDPGEMRISQIAREVMHVEVNSEKWWKRERGGGEETLRYSTTHCIHYPWIGAQPCNREWRRGRMKRITKATQIFWAIRTKSDIRKGRGYVFQSAECTISTHQRPKSLKIYEKLHISLNSSDIFRFRL